MAEDGNWKAATRIVHAGRAPHANEGFINPPVFHASTVIKPTLAEWEATDHHDYAGYSYGRLGTPTSRAFETAMASLYGCHDAIAVSSGLAAITLAMTALTKAGDHVLASDSVYYPCRRFSNQVLSRFGVEVEYFDPMIGGDLARLMRKNTVLVCAESPGSITFEVQDIPAIAKAAHAAGALVMIDNTWATGLHCNPFRLGVDVVVEATTKFVAGHSDLTLGVILAGEQLAPKLRRLVNVMGICSGADDLYLAQRGLRTLAARLAQHQASGLRLARWFQARPEVARVLYPALPEDPGHALWRRDFCGAPGLFSVVFKPAPHDRVAAFCDALRLFGIGASWGGFESLIHPYDPNRFRSVTAWPDEGPLIRFHVGLEDPGDLERDLEGGFAAMARG